MKTTFSGVCFYSPEVRLGRRRPDPLRFGWMGSGLIGVSCRSLSLCGGVDFFPCPDIRAFGQGILRQEFFKLL